MPSSIEVIDRVQHPHPEGRLDLTGLTSRQERVETGSSQLRV